MKRQAKQSCRFALMFGFHCRRMPTSVSVLFCCSKTKFETHFYPSLALYCSKLLLLKILGCIEQISVSFKRLIVCYGSVLIYLLIYLFNFKIVFSSTYYSWFNPLKGILTFLTKRDRCLKSNIQIFTLAEILLQRSKTHLQVNVLGYRYYLNNNRKVLPKIFRLL